MRTACTTASTEIEWYRPSAWLYGVGPILPPYDVAQVVIRVGCVAYHVLRAEFPPPIVYRACCNSGVASLPSWTLPAVTIAAIGNSYCVSQRMRTLYPQAYFLLPSVLVLTTHPASWSEGLPCISSRRSTTP